MSAFFSREFQNILSKMAFNAAFDTAISNESLPLQHIFISLMEFRCKSICYSRKKNSSVCRVAKNIPSKPMMNETETAFKSNRKRLARVLFVKDVRKNQEKASEPK